MINKINQIYKKFRFIILILISIVITLTIFIPYKIIKENKETESVADSVNLIIKDNTPEKLSISYEEHALIDKLLKELNIKIPEDEVITNVIDTNYIIYLNTVKYFDNKIIVSDAKTFEGIERLYRLIKNEEDRFDIKNSYESYVFGDTAKDYDQVSKSKIKITPEINVEEALKMVISCAKFQKTDTLTAELILLFRRDSSDHNTAFLFEDDTSNFTLFWNINSRAYVSAVTGKVLFCWDGTVY